MDNPVMFVSSRASNLNVLLAKKIVKNTHLPLRFRRLRHKQKQHTNHLIVFNVEKIRLHTNIDK
jgi:Fe2+ or Zn2+ uptake regulation protein